MRIDIGILAEIVSSAIYLYKYEWDNLLKMYKDK